MMMDFIVIWSRENSFSTRDAETSMQDWQINVASPKLNDWGNLVTSHTVRGLKQMMAQ